jgi:hypothetical protein
MLTNAIWQVALMRGELGRVYLAKGAYEDALVEMRRVMHITAEALGTNSLLRDMCVLIRL